MSTKHPLAAWIESRSDISQAQFAANCDCSEGHLSLILAGKRGVSMKLARRFSDATGGEVKIDDFPIAEDARA